MWSNILHAKSLRMNKLSSKSETKLKEKTFLFLAAMQIRNELTETYVSILSSQIPAI